MPPLTRWFIKIALLYLIAALLLGIALIARPIWTLPPFIAALGPVYFHLFMVGWVTQVIFGVVYWMFPKYSKEKPHGSEGLWQATFWLLNLGLLLRLVSEPIQVLSPATFWGWSLALSAVLQWLAGVIFAVNTWGRVKER
jgi:cbb3-type cytochrome oxidase subunit 1